MIYNLRIDALGFDPGIELTATEYTTLVDATDGIRLATDVEEKLDLLLENYLEYERELLQLALQSSLFTAIDEHREFTEAQLVNRRVINLLSSARMYIDQVKHCVSRYSSSTSAPDVATLFSAEYDQHWEYRVAEELRNHSQHRALPVHYMTWRSGWEERDSERKRLRFSVVPSVSLKELENEGGFKPAVLADLRKSSKERFHLTPILRRYVECLASVHVEIRRSLNNRAKLDREVLSSALTRARTELGNETGLAATAGEDPELPQERHYISDRSWQRRETLVKKNSLLTNLSRRFVSSEHAGDAKAIGRYQSQCPRN